jgi:hypothetical protein
VVWRLGDGGGAKRTRELGGEGFRRGRGGEKGAVRAEVGRRGGEYGADKWTPRVSGWIERRRQERKA